MIVSRMLRSGNPAQNIRAKAAPSVQHQAVHLADGLGRCPPRPLHRAPAREARSGDAAPPLPSRDRDASRTWPGPRARQLRRGGTQAEHGQ